MTYTYADTRWMDANFGISVHWTSHTIRQDGSQLPYQDAVAQFDVERFADTLASVNARHCIFTLTHACHYLAMPHPLLDQILPGRTAGRDLIGELIAALAARHIRFIVYYNHACNGNDDPEWKTACGYAAGRQGDLNAFARNICGIVSAISRRYGSGLAGWWFDSAYSVDPRGPHNTVSCDLGDWQFPWLELNRAAKSGNPDAAVCFNAGVGQHFLYALCQDYLAGEATALDTPFTPPPPPQLHDHRWLCLDSPAWVFSRRLADTGFVPPQFNDDALRAYIDEQLQARRLLTFNLLVDQTGLINPLAIAQLQRLA